jgi:DNA-binding HxlR family transcriptional regulator
MAAVPRVSFADMTCSIARTLDVVGDRWTLLILRDVFRGIHRFDGFLESLPIARNVLADRLGHLVERGVLRREQYAEHPPRYEYRLTRRGRELYPVLLALMDWGDQHLPREAAHDGRAGAHPVPAASHVCPTCNGRGTVHTSGPGH